MCECLREFIQSVEELDIKVGRNKMIMAAVQGADPGDV